MVSRISNSATTLERDGWISVADKTARIDSSAEASQAVGGAISWGAPSYPAGLRDLESPPAWLYVAGALPPQETPAIAIVGSRRASSQALRVAFEAGFAAASAGVTVASGLAEGVDAAAHRGALASGTGATVAFVGTGLDQTFPSMHADLDHQIRLRGAVVSQFPAGTLASKSTFPARNALIAGYGDATFVPVAAERSGTRIAIQRTLELGKTVIFWAPIMREHSWAGDLVASGQAVFVDQLDDLIDIVRSERGRNGTTHSNSRGV